MESQRFDQVSRMMASGASRRTVLRGLFGGALAAAGLHAGGAAAPKEKVDICHYDADTGSYHWIRVNGNAVEAHLAHGDNGDAGCPVGYEFNAEACACVLANECEIPDGSQCTGGGFCAQDVESGKNICVGNGYTESTCSDHDDCGANRVCVVDTVDTPHCHDQL